MSKTYRDKYRVISDTLWKKTWDRYKYGILMGNWELWQPYGGREHWNALSAIPVRHRRALFHKHIFSGCPRRWNKLFHIRPHRRANKKLCRQIRTNIEQADGLPYPLSHKPHIYYW